MDGHKKKEKKEKDRKKKQERGSSYKGSMKTQFNQGKALSMKGSWV